MATILIIDDEPMVRYTVRTMLEDSGHMVIEAEDGRVGIEQYLGHKPDVIITDIIMPDQEGIETIRTLRGLNAHTKIIAFSGGGRLGSMDFLDVAKKLGADEILEKPVRRDEILRVIDELLEQES